MIWAGTDDGNIQVTTRTAVRRGRNVTPPSIKPWTRIFNIDAGHFDNRTAYAAANTLRIDDINPHFWRTHDGGKTWTEINTGIAPGAVANSIREDPRTQGAALRRDGHAGLGVVRRWRSLAVAQARHAGDLRARSRR